LMAEQSQFNTGLFCKIRIFGKAVTAEEARKYLVKEVTSGTKIAKISFDQNITRKTIYEYLKWAETLNEIKKQDGKWVVNEIAKETESWRRFDENHSITSDPYIQEWKSDLMTRGHGGGPIKQAREQIRYLEKFCNYLKINPVQLIFSKERKVVEKYLTSMSELIQSGKTEHKPRKKKTDGTVNYAYVMKRYKDSVRSFVQYHGIAIPNRTKGILANPVIGHGQYADVKLTDDELHLADVYLMEKYGQYHEFYRLFWVGVESCARKNALLTMPLDWREVRRTNGTTMLEMTVVETKTIQKNEGKWTKYIQRTKTIEALKHAKQKVTSGLLYDGAYHTMYETFKTALKDLYRHLGKTHTYFYEHAIHALRHIGAHYWLRKTKYNYVAVAKIGGWHTVQELKDSYGEMPSDILFDILDNATKELDQL